MITILNTSIVTSDHDFSRRPCTLAEAQALVASRPNGIQSAVGHQATAEILSDLLGAPVPVNRMEYEQRPGDLALVFKLNGRPPEGRILSRKELEEIGYTFKLLYCMEPGRLTDARDVMRARLADKD